MRVFQEYSTGQYTLGEIIKKAKEWGLRKVFHKRQIQELQRESEGIQGKLDKLMDLLLDGRGVQAGTRPETPEIQSPPD